MKNQIIALVLALYAISISYGQEKLNIDVTKSEIKWFGEYTFYFGGHEGTISFKEGHFIKSNGKITGGEFIIDMTSIICTDMDSKEAQEGLVSHLKDSDFFEVNNYETASLVIENVKYHDSNHMKIYADLTIKGITVPVNFQAEVNFEEEIMITQFKIDRMKWGISYNSKIKDNAISDAIGFKVKLSL